MDKVKRKIVRNNDHQQLTRTHLGREQRYLEGNKSLVESTQKDQTADE